MVLKALDAVRWWVSGVVLRFAELTVRVGADAACVRDRGSGGFLEVLNMFHGAVVLAVACDAAVRSLRC